MSAVSPSISKWVKRLLADVQEDGLPNRIELFHTVDGQEGDRCQTFPLEGGGVDADLLAEDIWQVAETDAATRPAGIPNRYVLQAFMAEDDSKARSTHPFVIRGGQSSSALGDGSDSPTDRGERGMLLRHTEALTRITTHTLETAYERAQTELQNERNARMRAEEMNLKYLQTFQDLEDRKNDREIKYAQETSKMKIHADLASMVLGFLPIAAAHFMGGDKGGASHVRDMAVKQLIKRMSQDEVMKIASGMSAENQLLFFEVFKSYQKEELAEQQNRPALLRDVAPPEEPEPEKPSTH